MELSDVDPNGTRTMPLSFLPLKPRTLSVLTALAVEPLHGYAVMSRLKDQFGPRTIGPATLYRSLQELEDRGLIQVRGRGEAPRRGATYELTQLGRQVLRAEIDRLDGLTSRARAALTADR